MKHHSPTFINVIFEIPVYEIPAVPSKKYWNTEHMRDDYLIKWYQTATESSFLAGSLSTDSSY